jgi:uncharacterized protein (DUF1501 family)
MCTRHMKKSVTRRDILRYSLAGAGLAALGPLGRGLLPTASGAPQAGLKRVVSIFGFGGWDGLHMLIPTGNAAYYDRRPTISVAETAALDIGEDSAGYRLHPSFTRLAELYNAGTVAIFRKVGYPNADLSHFVSQDVHSWGVRGGFDALGLSPSGWMARYADLHASTALGAVSLGVGRPLELEGGSSHPFMAGRLSSFAFSRSSISSAEHEQRLASLTNVLQGYSGPTLSTEARNALDQGVQLADLVQGAVADYQDDVTGSAFKDLYPTDSPGRYLEDIATLIRGGFETSLFMTGVGGWDTHGDQGSATGNQANLIARVDAGIGTFVDECKDMGTWNDTLILLSSEFGRRNFENGSNGTDHGHGNIFFAIGGNVNGGLYGPDITESDIADNNWLSYGLDYRDIFKEAVGNHLGGNTALVFPETQVINTTLNYI